MTNVQEIWDMMNVERLKDLPLGFLSVPSPTCDELAFGEHLAECLRQICRVKLWTSLREETSPIQITAQEAGA